MFDQNPPPTKLPLLPEEILVDEILPRLPVKTLSIFKCVSKPWRSLIKSDRFIKIHYRNSAKNPRFITYNPVEHNIKVGDSLQSLLDSKEGSVPTKIERKFRVGLLGCCNGVVCSYGGDRFSLWNPATRASAELPNIEGYSLLKWGFGWDESSGAYKVFVVLFMKARSGWVYSSNTNSWRKSPGGSDRVFHLTGMFLRGNLHWADVRLPQVECFDLGMEEFGRIELPMISSNDGVCYRWLGEIRGSLSISIYKKKGLEVWVMKDYGVKDSWLKILTFPSTSLYDPTIYLSIHLLGEGPNGEIFVCFRNNLTVYSPKDDAFSTVTTKDDPFVGPHIYVESLVSPKRIMDATITNTTS